MIELFATSLNGVAVVNDSPVPQGGVLLRYMPVEGFLGLDSFVYQVTASI